jgi:hypothetical protein
MIANYHLKTLYPHWSIPVKDSQCRQQTEALRLVRRIRAKRYLLLKLGKLSTTEGPLYTLLVGDLATTARLP